jgi:hypothetical protein
MSTYYWIIATKRMSSSHVFIVVDENVMPDGDAGAEHVLPRKSIRFPTTSC